MFNSPIRKAVLRAVNEKIDAAEKEYNEQEMSLDANYEEDLVNLANKLKSDKDSLAKRLVDSIVGKFLS